MAAALHRCSSVSAASIAATPTYQNDSKTASMEHSQIRSFKAYKSMSEISQLHCQLTKQGLSHMPPTLPELIVACAEMGTFESLDYARKAFELIRESLEAKDTLYLYNSLIRGHSFAGLSHEAISLYIQMISAGIIPDNFTFPFVLSACSKAAALLGGAQLHGAVYKMGLEGDVFIRNSLIHLYAESGEINLAQKVFDEMLKRNIVSWTSLICGYARIGSPKEAVYLFLKMVETGMRPNSVTIVCAISACARLKDLELGEMVFAYIGKLGLELNTYIVNALLDMYMKCGEISVAKRLFDECIDKSLVLYNTMMSNYVQHGRSEEIFTVLREMQQRGLPPDKVTLLSLISACGELCESIFGKCCHGYALRNGLAGWANVCNSLIAMYMKRGDQEMAFRVFNCMPNKNIVSWNSVVTGFIRNGDFESAMETFDEMPEKDHVSWNTMISALVQCSMFEEALELFREAQSKRVVADSVTMVEVASACGYLGTLDLAKWIYAYILKNKIHCDMLLGTALVDMFARCGDLRAAIEVFNKMERRDVSAWTAAIGAMAMEGNGEKAIALFKEMLRQGIKPDGVVFVNVLTACSHGGFVEQGRQLFQSTKIHGISLEIFHYGCMVDLLGRSGLLQEALDLINSMPMEPNEVIWGSLLAACRTHKNVELATHAAKKLAELAPERIGTQVLLSNIYASAGKWVDVAKVRLELKEKGIQKPPGSSLIEINGAIHEFTSGDESHLEKSSIGAMLEEMNCRLRDAGYVPDTTNVLVDVNEQEKKHLLSRHSERLAMAFGLISTENHVPIRVVKNLRMCSDCHSFAKLVSKVYDREVIVRDNNRFHFFRQGFCSCCDFW